MPQLFALCTGYHEEEKEKQGNQNETYMTALVMKDPIILNASPYRPPIIELRCQGLELLASLLPQVNN